MDYYSFGSNTRPSVTAKTADYDVPSFEEAFDTESLRRFFSCKDPLMTFQVQSHHKNPSMEEEIPSHTVELISPATTSHSTGILDIFSHHSEEMEHDVFSRTQSAHLNPSRNQVNHVNPAQKVPALIPQRTSVSENWGASNRTMHQTQQGPESGNLIAMLCQQIQGFYSEAPGQNNGGNLEAQLNGEAAGLVPKRKRSVWEDDDADPSVLKKIISKKGVFTVQKEAMSPNIQRKMSTQLGETQLKAKRKASAPALTAQMLDSGMGDFVLDGGQAVKEKETKPKKSSKKDKEKGEKAEKPEKPEKAEKTEKAEKAEKAEKGEKKSAQVNIQIGEMSGKKEKQGKSKKMVLGNLTIGMKNLGGQESKP